ncbi:uncharacterized protein LOC143083034 [Mytilus galloprovincialis]|uniref:uncharacterized protein LOC143083034 n=1 Tax=Mytilus galloprovincialis TaxID=29158 RepID=UPI003F7BF2DF
MADQNDSDSDWDSTLDFTSPRQPGLSQPPRIDIEIEDEDYSRQDSRADPKPMPAERYSVALNNKKNSEDKKRQRDDSQVPEIKEPPLYATVQKDSRGKVVETKTNDSPPYNFRQAMTGPITPDGQREPARPGKDRKGNLYDVARSPSDGNEQQRKATVTKEESFRSVNSWDSDADEKTLQELRQNFTVEKQREQEAESLKLQLQHQDPLYDDPMGTNRSEPTWKSLTSGFGEKIARLSGRGKTPKNNNRNQNDVPQQSRQRQEHRPQQPAPSDLKPIALRATQDIFRASGLADKEEVPETTEDDLKMFQSYAAPIFPPYVTKEDEGAYTYYFGHTNNLQQYEVEDEAEQAFMPKIAEKFERILIRIYQEFFGVIRIITSIAILLLVETLNYVLKYVLQPLVVGVLGTIGEFFFKPLLSIFFNGFVQPFGIFLWNAAVSFRHMFGPLGDILRRILKEVSMCCKSFKPIEIHWKTGHGTKTDIQNV